MTICSKLIVFRIHFNEAREVKSRVHWQSGKLVKWKFHRNSLECYFTQCDTPKKNEGSERNWLTDVRRSVKNTDKSNLDSDRMLTYRVELWFLGKLGNPNSYGNSLGSIRYRHSLFVIAIIIEFPLTLVSLLNHHYTVNLVPSVSVLETRRH